MSPINYDAPVYDYKTLYDNNQISMWLDLSTYCNAACPQCHRTDANGLGKAGWLPDVQWTLEEFKKMFPAETLSHIERFDICGTWGDPMMNKDIGKIVEHIIASSKCKIIINTNGSIRNEDWWWNLGVLTGKRLTVVWAIDGYTQEQHAKYRQQTELDKIVLNMEAFNFAGGRSEVFTVVFKHNEKDLHNIARLAKQKGADTIFFVKSNRFHHNSQDKFRYIDKDGQEGSLERSTLPDIEKLYWRGIPLADNTIKWIEHETTSQK